MKSFFLSISLVVICIFSFAQNTNPNSALNDAYKSNRLTVSISPNNNSMVNVLVAKIPEEQIKIRVKENKKVLYQKSYKNYAQVNLQYDISQFPTGKYTFEIIQDEKVVYSKVIIRKNSIMTLVEK
jgi:hypothetical protein